jgi:peptidyl-prolyl cis-trans isomerase SurA
MKKLIKPFVLALCGLATWPVLAQTVVLDSIVAIVEDDVVMASELRDRLATVRTSLQAQGVEEPPEDRLVRETLDRLILESIQLQRGQRAGVRISDAQLNDSINRIASQNRMTLDQFRQQLEAEGKSYQDMREDVRRELILQRVQSGNVNQRIQITEQEVDNYLESAEGQEMLGEEYRLFHAALQLPSEASDEERAAMRAFATNAWQRIQDGATFREVVSATDGPYTFSGGDLGWRKIDALPSLFREVVPTMERRQTAEPIEASSGFHLIYLVDKRGGQTVIPQTLVRHILLKPSAIRSNDETRELGVDLRRQVLEGGDFAALAREYSEDIGSAQEGGDLGWSSPGQMVPEFENVMDSTEIDDISQPFRSQFGWHILQVLDRRQEDVTETVARNRVREVLHQRKYQEELDAWLRKIRDEAFVDIK